MLSKALVLVTLALMLSGTYAGGWVDLFKFPYAGNPSIAMDISCLDATHCYIAGGDNSVGSMVYRFNGSAGADFLPCNITDKPMMFMTIALKGQVVKPFGVAAGLGLLNSGIFVADDEYTFSPAIDFVLIGHSQNARANANGDVLVMGIGGNDGEIAFSNNGGITFKNIKTGLKVPNEGILRYGAIVDSNTWYVTYGAWPDDDPTDDPNVKHITARHSVNKANHRFVKSKRGHHVAKKDPTGGYCAAIAKTTDGGKTWALQYQDATTFYLNGIDCWNATSCVAVGEGFDTNPGVRVMRTTDGKTWSTVFTLPSTNSGEYSFVPVRWIAPNEIWVGGSKEAFISAAIFYSSTDGGNTWAEHASIPGVGVVTAMDFENGDGYAVGVTIDDMSTVLKYVPSMKA